MAQETGEPATRVKRDPRVSPWAAQYIGPEEGDEQPEPVNVTRPRGKRNNPTVEAYLAEHPGEFTHRVTIERQPKPIPLVVRIVVTSAAVAWISVFLFTLVRDWNR